MNQDNPINGGEGSGVWRVGESMSRGGEEVTSGMEKGLGLSSGGPWVGRG